MNREERENIQDELLEYIEGTLSPVVVQRVQRRLEADPAYRQEYDTLRMLMGDLEQIGVSLDAATPAIDLVDQVMARVRNEKIVPLTPRRRYPRAVAWAASLAAAAALVLWFTVGLPTLRTSGFRVAQHAAAPSATSSAASSAGHDVSGEFAPLRDRAAQVIDALPQPKGRGLRASERFAMTQPPDLKDLTVSAVVKLAQDATLDKEARARLLVLAAPSADAARKILQEPAASPEAQAGAALALSSGESAAELMTVVGKYPDRAELQAHLAQVLAGQPAHEKQWETALSAARALDQDNALTYYQEAVERLRRGDLEGALAALDQARALEAVSAYAGQNARDAHAALVASGVDPSTAELLAALSAGNTEYDSLYKLGENLLQYGQQYAEQGNLEIAQQLYEAAHRLGVQVEQGAEFSQEQLAGLDVQRDSIEELQQLFTTMESTQGMEWLVGQTEALSQQLRGVSQALGALNSLFFGEHSTEFWGTVASSILRDGDLSAAQTLIAQGLTSAPAASS